MANSQWSMATCFFAQIKQWLTRDPDSTTRNEILALQEENNREALAARFSARLKFGTAGIRGVVGAGPSRINALVIRECAAGIGHYLRACNSLLPAASPASIIIEGPVALRPWNCCDAIGLIARCPSTRSSFMMFS